MTTEIQLHHIGEVILAGLLRKLSVSGTLDLKCMLHDHCGLDIVLAQTKIIQPIAFDVNVQLAPITINNEKLLFDGAHGVDVLCRGHGTLGLALEAKLGVDRMVSGAFKKRFMKTASLTTHKSRRIKGSMVSILNYRALQNGAVLPLRTAAEHPVEVVPEWFLVIRRPVWEQWNNGKSHPPPLSPNAHVMIFEDIVKRHGDGQSFDKLV